MFLLNVLLDFTDKLHVLIICNSKHFSFLVFYFNVSNNLHPSPAIKFSIPRSFQPPFLLGTQE